jgi:transcriptional regulator with XRE-family HTH domain
MKQIEDWGKLLKGIIKESRDRKGPDQKDAAASMGISAQVLSNRLKGDDPGIKTVIDIFIIL